MHAAALDPRVAGAASFAGFTPLRSDTLDRPTLGLRRLYDFHALLPRLGYFANDTAGVPYDYDELVAAVAPRPVLLYTPQQDRDATFVDVDACVAVLQQAWARAGASGNLTHEAPDKPTTMTAAETAVLLGWLDKVAGYR